MFYCVYLKVFYAGNDTCTTIFKILCVKNNNKFDQINVSSNIKLFFIEQKIINFGIQGLFKVIGNFKQNSRLFQALEKYFQIPGFFQVSRLGGNSDSTNTRQYSVWHDN